MADDRYEHHDYYLIDELLTDEHKLIRDTARAWVKKKYPQLLRMQHRNVNFHVICFPGLGEIGAFGPYIPSEYGGPDWIRSPTE